MSACIARTGASANRIFWRLGAGTSDGLATGEDRRGTSNDAMVRRIGIAERRVMADKPRVEITYCRQCRWLLRAAWFAQELLTTFDEELGEVALRPGTGGIFEIRADDALVWSRAAEGRFPEMKELKQRLRDRVAPGKPLGHSDAPAPRD